jgi:phosphoglycerol transferase MdoB-like AlkP superfamily enzyme
MDTHVPYFISKSCAGYASSTDPMMQAAHCTDQIVGDFVDFVRASAVAQNTVVALVSDHLLWGGIADHGLQIPDDNRRLTFLLDIPGAPPREIAAKGTEFDVGATLADALGVDLTSPGRIGLGSSLLVGDGYLWTAASGLPSDFEAIYAFTHSDKVRAFVDAARIEAPVPLAP